MSVKVKVAKTFEDKRMHYELRHKIMVEELGWIPQNGSYMEYDEFDFGQSIILLATEHNRIILGTCRLILEGVLPLPIHSHFKLFENRRPEPAGQAAEVSRFIIPHNTKYRRHEILLSICKKMLELCIAELELSHLFMSLDSRFFRLLKIIGLPIIQIGQSKYYLGSATVPGIIFIDDLYSETRLRKSALFEFLTIPKREIA